MYLIFKIDEKRNRELLGTFPDENIDQRVMELDELFEGHDSVFAIEMPNKEQIKVREATEGSFVKNQDGSITLR